MVTLSASAFFYAQNYATPKFHTNTVHLKGNYDHLPQEVKNTAIEQLNLQDFHAKARFKIYLLLDSKDNVTKLRVYIPQFRSSYYAQCNLYYFRARYYSDELGRFISRDPLGYVDGMRLYAGYFAQRFGSRRNEKKSKFQALLLIVLFKRYFDEILKDLATKFVHVKSWKWSNVIRFSKRVRRIPWFRYI